MPVYIREYRGRTVADVRSEVSLQWDGAINHGGVTCQILSPGVIMRARDKNDKSIVVKITNSLSHYSVVVTGDATAAVTDEIIQYYEGKCDLNATIFQANHHGSGGAEMPTPLTSLVTEQSASNSSSASLTSSGIHIAKSNSGFSL